MQSCPGENCQAGLWVVFIFFGVLWTTLAPFIDFDFRGTFGRYQYGLASAGTGAGLCLTGIYMLQSITFVHRSIVGFVDPLLHAFEMLGTLISLIDVASRWAYVCCDGFRQLMVHSFRGALFVDCLVCTATVGLGISAGPPGEEKRTWWSLSFLASTHVFRCLSCLSKGDTSKSQDNFKRQIAYVSVTVLNGMFMFAAIIMTLEILGPQPGSIAQDRLPGVEYPWTMSDGLVWSVSLFTLLGNSERTPSCSIGQIAAVFGLGVAIYQMARIVPVGLNALTGRASFVGRYPIESRQHRSDGHTIVTGSPTAKTLIEFLFEYYHPNHFAGGLDFEREARDVVVFLEDAKVLSHLRRLLDLKDASMTGPDDFDVAAYWAEILPNMMTSEVDSDDQANIMRRAPSVDAIKMGLLGKVRRMPDQLQACMFPGAITMISNLCVSVGEGTDVMYRVRRHWLSDYEHGLGNELYEVPLSTGYSGYTFIDAFEDVLVRSKGSTYLIGITDTVPLNTSRGHAKGEREVLINPGPDFELKVVEGRTAGVFIAPELDKIEQVPPGEDPKISTGEASANIADFAQAMCKSRPPRITLEESPVAAEIRCEPAGPSLCYEDLPEVMLGASSKPAGRCTALVKASIDASEAWDLCVEDSTLEEEDQAVDGSGERCQAATSAGSGIDARSGHLAPVHLSGSEWPSLPETFDDFVDCETSSLSSWLDIAEPDLAFDEELPSKLSQSVDPSWLGLATVHCSLRSGWMHVTP
ncbi:unnamed protein product [Symbiodinium sp. CCMP2456]|nr:unnamed protein product [Symbiodinium sp. CCMP2456]